MRLSFTVGLAKLSPPWLRRSVGGRVMQGIATVLDAHVVRVVESVRLRFPGFHEDAIDESALALSGRERRIRRGPLEDASTYAPRLRGFWDAHRLRGGPYALLEQLDAFFEAWLNVRMDVVYASGTRRWIDDGVPGVITRDAITWEADGSGKWARFWVFFYVPALIPGLGGDDITTEDDDDIITEGGDDLITDGAISPAELGDLEQQIFRFIPREWSAAHIDRIEVVLLWDERRLWNYPQPVPTWAEWGSTSTWSEPPTVLPIPES
jgi:hypothetical protein